MSADRDRHGLRFLLGEARAALEAGALLASLPWLARAPRGDGHAVVVLPGWLADDRSTLALRGFLRARGWRPSGWAFGRNLGPTDAVIAHLRQRIARVNDASGRRVSLVGWSLGGILARELARAMPERVRCVVTLASPFQQDPRRTPLWPWIDRFSRDDLRVLSEAEHERVKQPPPVPTTAVYSTSDGVVAPLWCRERAGAQAENVEVPASHLGIGVNPFALWLVADRLSQPEGAWKPFEIDGLWALVYRRGEPHPGPPAATSAEARRPAP